MGVLWAVFRCRFQFLLLFLLLSCSSATEVVTIDVHAAKDLINSGYRYLDVRWINRFSLWIGLSLKFLGWVLFWFWNLNWIHRTVEEFKKGHADVENILNIPYLFTTPEGTYIISGSVFWFVWDINIFCPGSRTSVKMIWVWVWISGRVKNPEFLEQVQFACSKEDHLIVVIFHLISRLNHKLMNFLKLFIYSQWRAVKVGWDPLRPPLFLSVL